jgi:hypothetical protein
MKRVLFTLLCIICFISFVNAKKCTVVSGKGFEIGTEIDCAGERFYLIENDKDEIKAMAKYNLLAGENYYRTEVFDNGPYTPPKTVLQEHTELCQAIDPKYSPVVVDRKETSSSYFCYYWEPIETEVKQDKTAIGAHGDEAGNPEFTEIGVVRDFYEENFYFSYEVKEEDYNNADFDLYNCAFNATSINDCSRESKYITDYKKTMKNKEVNIKEMDIITLKELNEVVKRINNGTGLPLDSWLKRSQWTEFIPNNGFDVETYRIGSIKDNIDSKYAWLYSTTYWTRTASINASRFHKVNDFYVNGSSGYVYFIDTLGDLCAQVHCSGAVGAGIRPIITLSKAEIEYEIETKTDGHGIVKSEKVIASSGEIIKFTVIPDEGYELGEVKVTDELGNVIIFKDYTFTMPYSDVLIEATFVKKEQKNPRTSDIAIIFIGIVFIASVLINSYSKNKIKN